MSFSTEIKKELSQINNLNNKQEVKFELLGYLISSNTSKNGKMLEYSTESEYNINRFGKLLKNVGIEEFSINIQGKIYNINFKSKYLEQVYIDEFCFCNYNKSDVIEFVKKMDNVDCSKSLIRGIFLGSGSVNNPENTYHLEMKVLNIELITVLIDLLKNYNIILKSTGNSLYIKDGEEISEFLAFIGGSNSVIKFEEIRVQRHMNNKINRLVNCETANLNKVLNASVEQINAIKKLKENGKFQTLDDSLKELAELRLEHPDFSLSELGLLLDKPIGKSGVNYRLKKIIELAK